MEPDFSTREIKHFFEEIKNSLVNQDKMLAEIKQQVIKTNGRVTALEFWKAGLIAKITGVMATLSIVWVVIKETLLK